MCFCVRACVCAPKSTFELKLHVFPQKATKKTDKPRAEEEEEEEVTDLSDEDLRQQLAKYGVDTGPIVGKGPQTGLQELQMQKKRVFSCLKQIKSSKSCVFQFI